MGDYEYLPHTADEKFHVTAVDLSDAFSTAVTALYGIMIEDPNTVEEKEEVVIQVQAAKLTTLLYDFLNELIFNYDEGDLLLCHVKSLSIQADMGYALTATLAGDTKEKYDIRTEIKSMTYSEMDIKNELGNVELTVVVDI